MDTQIVILAAGKGRRMGSKGLPKVLIPLKGKPVISYLVEELVKLKDLPPPIIVIGHRSTAIKQALGKSYRYALQRDQRGTAHAVWSAQPYITAKNLLVLYGDMPFIKATSLKKLIHLHDSQQAVISMFTSYVPNFNGHYENFLRFGRIIRNQYKEIVKIREFADATLEEQSIREINPGIYLFQSQWLWDNIDKIDDNNVYQEFYLTDIVEIAIQEGHSIQSLTISPKEIFGINTEQQLKQAQKLI